MFEVRLQPERSADLRRFPRWMLNEQGNIDPTRLTLFGGVRFSMLRHIRTPGASVRWCPIRWPLQSLKTVFDAGAQDPTGRPKILASSAFVAVAIQSFPGHHQCPSP
jgi:hypothetical protein